ncbi:MAG TPA: hypothetical protein PK323_04340 [Bacteroidia bacterium]|nr:hypothetical protein [Bacteroidia bacterium]
MRITYLLLIIPIALGSFNCKGSKKATKNDAMVKSETSENKSNQGKESNQLIFRFTVSFISKGAGTDYQMKQKYDAFITDFETRNKVKLLLSKASWGREGEVDYCFDMKELNKEITEKFIAESKAVLSASDRINIGENTNCRGTVK